MEKNLGIRNKSTAAPRLRCLPAKYLLAFFRCSKICLPCDSFRLFNDFVDRDRAHAPLEERAGAAHAGQTRYCCLFAVDDDIN